MPYDEMAVAEFRGELWAESFERGAFDGIETRDNTRPVAANRDHDRTRVVGKATAFHPSRQEGLIAEVKIANTVLGEETLALADERVLGVSSGFAARLSDQVFERSSDVPGLAGRRRVKKAFLDHIAFTGGRQAYEGARVRGVRDESANERDFPESPALDELIAWRHGKDADGGNAPETPALDELIAWRQDTGNITIPDAGDLNAAARRHAAARGWAMQDGSFPIRPLDNHGQSDLEKAIRAVGRAGGSRNAVRRHIMKRAQALGLTELIPETWNAGGSLRS